MPIKEILKTIYAPHKAFREILQNPRYLGPIIIMILFSAASLASTYVILTKTFSEGTLPETTDEWTENPALWQTPDDCIVKANFEDYIAGRIYGNRSIEFFLENGTEISASLGDIGPINCSINKGYSKLYLRIKLIEPQTPPENLSLYLYSSPEDYFYRDLTAEINKTSMVWNNLTIPLGDDSWNRVGNADWTRINGLKLVTSWPESSSLRILVDGLFFGGVFKPAMDQATDYLTSNFAYAFMQFIIRWVFLAGIAHIMCKSFKGNVVWRVTLILIGFALITMFFQALANTAAFTLLPTLKYPFQYIGGVEGEAAVAYQKLMEETQFVNQIFTYIQAVTMIWTVLLCTFAIRSMTEFSWSKSLLVATVAYFLTLTLEGFLV
ncbi:YIP1 family protein [Candidatus Bathyarchaeota archaeon]|nr:YIP1 family protein [Candidatus Bathyarchaeota archaeon]